MAVTRAAEGDDGGCDDVRAVVLVVVEDEVAAWSRGSEGEEMRKRPCPCPSFLRAFRSTRSFPPSFPFVTSRQ